MTSLHYACVRGYPNSVSVINSHSKYRHFVCNGHIATAWRGDKKLIRVDKSRNFEVSISAAPIWMCGDRYQLVMIDTNGTMKIFEDNWKKPVLLDKSKMFRFCAVESGLLAAIPTSSFGLTVFSCSYGELSKAISEQSVFVDCAVSNHDVYAIDDKGKLWCWSAELNNLTERTVEIEKRACRVWAFRNRVYVLNEDMELYAYSNSSSSVLGVAMIPKYARNGSIVFVRVPKFTDSRIIRIVGTNYTTFALTEDGNVYGVGDLSSFRFGRASTFQKVDYFKGNAQWIDTDDDLVVVGTDMDTPLDPCVGFFPGKSLPRYMTGDGGQEVNISEESIVRCGLVRNAMCVVSGKEYRVFGVSGNALVMENNCGDKQRIAIDDWQACPISVKMKLDKFQTVTTRSGMEIDIDTSATACRGFGFFHGERVHHELAGDGVVVGVMGGSMWFIWDDDDGRASRVAADTANELHSLIEIVGPINRTIQQTQLPTGDIIQYETSPCTMLADLGLKVGDLVQYGRSTLEILGEFTYHCYARNIHNNECMMVIPSNVVIRRRLSSDPVLTPVQNLTGDVMDVDVSYTTDDALWPLDRIVTVKGTATVVGKTDAGLWILTDDAYVRQLGVVVLDGPHVLLRRDGASCTIDGRKISIDASSANNVMPGDYVDYKGRMYVNTGLEGRAFRGMVCLRDVETGELLKVSRREMHMMNVLMRAGFPATIEYMTTNEAPVKMSTNLADFEGIGVKPGDVVTVKEHGKGRVVGIYNGNVWLHFESDCGATYLSDEFFSTGSWSHIERLVVDVSKWTK